MVSSPKGNTTTGQLIAWALYDWANSAFFAVIQTFVFAAYFVEAVAQNPVIGSTQWGNIIGFAGLSIAIAGPVLGAVADQYGRQKPWVFGFSLLCIIATAALWFVQPDARFTGLALLLVFLGTVGSECAIIFYNAMLTDLAPKDKMGRWSGWGWGIGYAGGLVCLVVALFIFINTDVPPFGLNADLAEPIRATFLLTAVWYLLFSLPLFFKTPDTSSSKIGLYDAVRRGWEQVRNTLQEIKKYRSIFHFLIARLIFMDALATVFAFGGIYAAGTFDMTTEQVLMFGIGLNLTAGIGAVGFAWLDDWLGSRKTMLISLVFLTILTAFLLVVTNIFLFWILGLCLGVFVGPVQAASRTYMAHAAPPNLNNEMFGLMALSGKVTAFAGPFLVAWLTYLAGSQRIGMSVIVVLFAAGFLLLLRVPDAKNIDRF